MGGSENFTKQLLARAHSPASVQRIFKEKIQHKPELLAPTEGNPKARQDARARRRARREALTQAKRRKPRPLSAREKRALRIYEIPAAERKYSLYVGLYKLWCGYMREILHVPTLKPHDTAASKTYQESQTITKEPTEEERKRFYDALLRFRIDPTSAGPKLVSADFHGAKVTVVRSRCVSRVGLQGIVIRDTKFTFEMITPQDELKTVPKEYTVFRIQVPLFDAEDVNESSKSLLKDVKELVFELHGEQFQNRAPDRANKKLKTHIAADL